MENFKNAKHKKPMKFADAIKILEDFDVYHDEILEFQIKVKCKYSTHTTYYNKKNLEKSEEK